MFAALVDALRAAGGAQAPGAAWIDVQALMPVIEAAGGIITNWAGGACDQSGPVLACGDPALHADLLVRLGANAQSGL